MPSTFGPPPSPSAVLGASGWRRTPSTPAVGTKTTFHFVAYGGSKSACGQVIFTMEEDITDLRKDTTCVKCLQVMLDKTEARVIGEVEKHLEESLKVDATEGWQEQVAQGLLRSFEVGEQYVIDNLERDLKVLMFDWDCNDEFTDTVLEAIERNRKKRTPSE